jgi:hypothetical protein
VVHLNPTNVTHSKPDIFRVTIIGFCLCLIIVLLFTLAFEWMTGLMGLNVIAQTFLSVFTILASLFILVELPIVLSLTIDSNKIVVKNLLTRRKKDFFFEHLDSFKISIQLRIRSRFHFDLILLRDGKALEAIPLKYVDNLDQIIKELENHLKNSTEDEYGFLRYIREQKNTK